MWEGQGDILKKERKGVGGARNHHIKSEDSRWNVIGDRIAGDLSAPADIMQRSPYPVGYIKRRPGNSAIIT